MIPSIGTAVVLAGWVGMRDGFSADVALWTETLSGLGIQVRTVAGEGPADIVLRGLASRTGDVLRRPELEAALEGADIVLVQSSRDLAASAGPVVISALSHRRVLWRHHDLPWQPSGGGLALPSRMASWSHVTCNDRSRLELEARGLRATTIYRLFHPEPPEGDREVARARLGVDHDETLVLQPTRLSPEKNAAGGIRLAAALKGSYLLLGDLGPEPDATVQRLGRATGVRLHCGELTLADAYCAADVVVLPSIWEAFGNATVESALYGRPLALGPYPVASELRRYGFRWFDLADPGPLRRQLAAPEPVVTRRNLDVARARFTAEQLPRLLEAVL